MDAKKSAPRYAPKNEWPTLPVQPPAGTWQLRAARLLPTLIVNIILVFLFVLTVPRNSAAWVLVWILAAGFILHGVLFIGAGVRGTQLEKRERELGYSTWARKR
jgi:hypothetical protein